MKQKIVIRVSMDGKRCLPKGIKCLIYLLKLMVPYEIIWKKRSPSSAKMRAKTMQTAVTCPGVTSVAIQGEDKNELVAMGERIDAYKLAKLIRQNVGFAEVLSVGPNEEKK